MHHLHCIFIVCPTKACDYKLLDLIKPILVENCHSVLHLQMQVAWKRTKQRKAKEKQTPESAGTSMPPETWSWKSTQGQKPKQSKKNTENTWKTQRIWKKICQTPSFYFGAFLPCSVKCPGSWLLQEAHSKTHPATCHLTSSKKNSQHHVPKSLTNDSIRVLNTCTKRCPGSSAAESKRTKLQIKHRYISSRKN